MVNVIYIAACLHTKIQKSKSEEFLSSRKFFYSFNFVSLCDNECSLNTLIIISWRAVKSLCCTPSAQKFRIESLKVYLDKPGRKNDSKHMLRVFYQTKKEYMFFLSFPFLMKECAITEGLPATKTNSDHVITALMLSYLAHKRLILQSRQRTLSLKNNTKYFWKQTILPASPGNPSPVANHKGRNELDETKSLQSNLESYYFVLCLEHGSASRRLETMWLVAAGGLCSPGLLPAHPYMT